MDPPDPPPSVFVSFTDTPETRVCGNKPCQLPYASCTQEEKRQWKQVFSSRITAGSATRWLCGTCKGYYLNKDTTHRRGAKANLTCIKPITDFLLLRRSNYHQQSRAIPYQQECGRGSERKRYVCCQYIVSQKEADRLHV